MNETITKTSRAEFFASLARSRAGLVQLVLAAVVLAFGVELTAAGTASAMDGAWLGILVVGIIICALALLWLTRVPVGSLKEAWTCRGILLYDCTKGEMVNLSRYPLSESVVAYVQAALHEEPRLRKQWEQSPPCPSMVPAERPVPDDTFSTGHIQHAVECFLLSTLGINLHMYFSQLGTAEHRLAEYRPEDIPAVLMRNPLVALFSTNLAERPVFRQELPEAISDDTVFASIPGKAVYEQFKLVLPKEATLSRPSERCIVLETNGFSMSLGVECSEGWDLLPAGFTRHYLGLDDEDALFHLAATQITVSISVSLTLRAFLTEKGWAYYRWADSFLSELENSVSAERFFSMIGWPTAFTVLQCLENKTGKPLRGRRRRGNLTAPRQE